MAGILPSNGYMGDEPPESTEILQGGRGGRGGAGGAGGHGGVGSNGTIGEAGAPGEPGDPGGPGSIRYINSNTFSIWSSLAAIMAVIAGAISGVVWVVELKGDFRTGLVSTKGELLAEIQALRIDLTNLNTNIQNFNTPLSQKVFAVEARTSEIGRIQQEIRARVESIDANGSTPSKILKRDIDTMRSDISSQNIHSQEIVRRLNELNRDTLENKIRIQNIIEALSPHEPVRRK